MDHPFAWFRDTDPGHARWAGMINARRTALAALVCIAAALTTGLAAGTAGARLAPDTVSIDPDGRVAKDGTITLTGTYRCSPRGSGSVLIGSKALQGANRAELDGSAATCDNRSHTWRGTGDAPGVRLVPGAATAEAHLVHLDTARGLPFPVILTADRAEVRLRRG
jgi:hypothetical protein